MANSLRSKIKKLCHDNNISEKMCNELLEKLEGHDRELRAKVIDEFFEELQKYEDDDMWLRLKMSSIYEIAEQMKEK